MDDDADNCDNKFSFSVNDTRVSLIWHRRAYMGSVRIRL